MQELYQSHLILSYLGLGSFSKNVTPSHSLATFDAVIYVFLANNTIIVRKLKVTIIYRDIKSSSLIILTVQTMLLIAAARSSREVFIDFYNAKSSKLKT